MTYDPKSFVSFDTETHLIEPGMLAPPLVCGSSATGSLQTGKLATLLSKQEALEQAANVLTSQWTMVGANIAFDLGVLAKEWPSILPYIFDAFAEGRVYDVLIAQALDAIAGGHLFRYPPNSGGLAYQPLRHPKSNKITDRYSLDLCCQLMLGRFDAKENDYWRMRYGILEQVPMDRWPETARQYPVDDAVNTLEVALAQVASCKNLDDLPAQVETHFDLHLGAMRGIRTDRARVEALEAKVEAKYLESVGKFREAGIISEDGKDNRKEVKRRVALAYGVDPESKCSTCAGTGKVKSEKTKSDVQCKACDATGLDLETSRGLPRTPSGGVATDRDTIMESGDEMLHALGENEWAKIRETYLPFLKQGIDRPITLSPNVLVESGRTSYSGLIQLLPRAGGVRDCFKARDGYVFLSVDYSALELCTLAQITSWVVGYSKMAEAINLSRDPGFLHTALAGRMLGKTEAEMRALMKAKDPVAKNTRQAAKPFSFGVPGGMGASKIVLANRKASAGSTTGPDGTVYAGIRFCILIGGEERCGHTKVVEWKKRAIPPTCKRCLEVAEFQLKPAFMAQWPEVSEYHAWIAQNAETPDENGMVSIPSFCPTEVKEGSVLRMRGNVGFCDAANHCFQSLAADGAKAALRAVTRECYLDHDSPLYGTRPIIFVHDEIFAETPEDMAHLAGPRMAEVMIREMRRYTPDVWIAAEPALQRYWTKGAEAKYIDGRLVPWDDPE